MAPATLGKPRTRLDKYEIISRLGSGGMGSVYLARDLSLDRGVAIKLLRGPVFDDDDELLARFLREARATANLRHQNIVTVYEVGQHEQQPFIAMEYVAGDSMATLVREQRPIPLVTRLEYLEQVCAGLHFAHRAGVVHRDVKPANLMVDTQGIVRILDFGIARLEGSGMTRDGAMMGTINYMSPEQMIGRPVDHRSDIFAVGAVAYELFAYQQAFPGTLEDGLLDRLPREPPASLSSLCPGLDATLETIVLQALEKKPDDRFSDLAQMQSALAAVRHRIDAERGRGFVLPTTAPPVHAETLVRPGSSSRNDAKSIRALLDKASKALETGDFASAVAIAERVIARAPSSVEAHALLLRAHQATARRSEARHDPHRYSKRLVAGAGLGIAAAATVIAAWFGPFRQEESLDESRNVVVSAPAAPAPAPQPTAVTEPRPTVPEPSPRDFHAGETATVADPVRRRTEPVDARAKPASITVTAVPVAPTPAPEAPAPSPDPGVPDVAAPAPEATAPAPDAVTPSVVAPPVTAPIERDRPGILAALNQYRAAYQTRSVDALQTVYPSLERETRQALERSFKDCRAYDVVFGEPDIAFNGDNAFVEVTSTYICTPKTRQRPPAEPVKDVFRMRKTASAWVIVGMGAMNVRPN
jgi:serine/threonine protein kinase